MNIGWIIALSVLGYLFIGFLNYAFYRRGELSEPSPSITITAILAWPITLACVIFMLPSLILDWFTEWRTK